MNYEQCRECVEKVTIVGLYGNSGLAVVKALGGIFGNSAALIADAIHSIADVTIAVLVHFSVKISKRPADKAYPFGYGHVEFITSAIVGISLLCVSFAICWTSISTIIAGEITEPEMIALLVLIISITGNELLFRFTICAGRQANSPAIISAAYEDRADVLTSIAALIGVIGAKLGLYILDPLAAVFVGLVIAHSSVGMLAGSVRGMMDTAVEPEGVEHIRDITLKVDGVKEINGINAHRSGQKMVIGIEVSVDFKTDLKKAENISEEIKKTVINTVGNIASITVNLRPWRPRTGSVS